MVLTALPLLAVLAYLLRALDQALAPYNIVDLEFAFTPERAEELIAAWGQAGNAAARQSLWLDFLYMPAYAFFFGGLALFAARAASGHWQTLGLWLTLFPFMAAALDAIENIALLNSLPPAAPASAPLLIAGVAAALKFGVLILCWLYTLAVPSALSLMRLRRLRDTWPPRVTR
jgi:hypothetical protein